MLTCIVEVVENLATVPVVTWIDPRTGDISGQMTDGKITTRILTFSPLSTDDFRVYRCEGCVNIPKVSIEGHCGQTMPCIASQSKC